MQKFTMITEEENIDLENFEITEDQFHQYKNRTYDILHRQLYVDHLETIENLGVFVKALEDDKAEGRDFSIFNKINTNVALMRWIVRVHKLESFNELLGFIQNNKFALFTKAGRYYSQVRSVLLNTEKNGMANEEFAAKHIKFIVKKELGFDIDPKVSPPMSREDMIHGVDVKFEIEGKEYTCQVKPLVRVTSNVNSKTITSSGRIKPYKTDYMAFVDRADSEIILVRNSEKYRKNILIRDDKVEVPIEAIVE